MSVSRSFILSAAAALAGAACHEIHRPVVPGEPLGLPAEVGLEAGDSVTLTWLSRGDQLEQPLHDPLGHLSVVRAESSADLRIIYHLQSAAPSAAYSVGARAFWPSEQACPPALGQFDLPSCSATSGEHASRAIQHVTFGRLTTDEAGDGTLTVKLLGIAPGTYQLAFDAGPYRTSSVQLTIPPATANSDAVRYVGGMAASLVSTIAVQPANPTLDVGQAVQFTATATLHNGSQRVLSQALAVTANDTHTCVLLADGTVACWGDNAHGQLGDGSTTSSASPVTVNGISTAIGVAAGGFHTCAVLADGTVRCWGALNANNVGHLGDGTTNGSANPVTVSGITSATAIAAGASHTCALLAGGTVKCWGFDGNGELGDGRSEDPAFLGYSATPVTVSGITNATAIAAGPLHACAVLSSGAVNCWGGNAAFEVGTEDHAWTPASISGIATATGLAVGRFFSCALLANGSVQCWGGNQFGQLGNGTTTRSLVPVAVSGITTAVALGQGWGAQHSCAILVNGGLQCWGDNASGQLGNGTVTGSLVPVGVSGIAAATAATTALRHTCALLADGSISCWGDNASGQLGNGSTISSSTPVAVRGLTASWSSTPAVATIEPDGNATGVGAGTTTITATSDGVSGTTSLTVRSTLSVGVVSNGSGRVTSSDSKIDCPPTCAASYTTSTTVTLTAIPALGSILTSWSGACTGTEPCTIDVTTPKSVVATFDLRDFTLSVTNGGGGTVTSSPAGISCGTNCSAALPAGTALSLTAKSLPGFFFAGWTGVCTGTGGCAVTMDADKAVTATFTPVTLTSVMLTPGNATLVQGRLQPLTLNGTFNDGSTRAISGSPLEAGDQFTCATLVDGSARCWGSNAFGQLGNGGTIGSTVPVTVGEVAAAVALGAGTSHACAVLTDGTVRCWGANSAGQLGDGTTTSSSTPVTVVGITSAVAVAAGSQHTCALLANGTVHCWGSGTSLTPTQVAGISDAVLISAEGGASTCVVLRNSNVKCLGALPVTGLAAASDVAAGPMHWCTLVAGSGKVQCWGSNHSGILGDGTQTDSPTPVDVVGITDAVAITAGDVHTCALLTGGTVRCWGNGTLGQLGNGGFSNSSVPVAVTGLSGVATAVAPGDLHTCAVLVSGSVQCWGSNQSGQLGNGATGLSATPVAVSGLTTAVAIRWNTSDPAVATVTADGVVVGLAPGTATVTASTGTFSASSLVTVVNTATGTNVQVQPVDATTGTAPATVTFASVTQAGTTSLSTGATGPTPPAGFQLGDPPTYYDLTTTAVFSGTIQVCISYAGLNVQDPSSLKLYHYEAGAWVDRTSSLDTVEQIICATVSTLSPFAIFEPDHTPPVVSCTVTPERLWPPDHRLVPVTATVTITDEGSGPAGFALVSITSSEPDQGLGDGDVPGDIRGFTVGAASTSGWLRAERSGRGTGRVYALTYVGADRGGNSTACTATVRVPHEARQR